MVTPDRARPALRIFCVFLGLAIAAAPASLVAAPQARLVHCGDQTCLRISGHRADASVIVRAAGHNLAVEGDHSWRTTVPLSTASAWANVSGGTLMLTFADTRTGTETVDAVALPPGALGKRVTLATLVVRAY
jgi:hypothetical protein